LSKQYVPGMLLLFFNFSSFFYLNFISIWINSYSDYFPSFSYLTFNYYKSDFPVF
jgi:hypothetical protein